MKTKAMVCAFLRCGDEVLLIHRGLHKAIAPGMWSGIGGHMEEGELNDPLSACFREIKEETGIEAAMIKTLNLRYIAIRHNGREITHNYIFHGEVLQKAKLPFCDEETLHWMALDQIAALEMTFSIKQAALHWLDHQDDEETIFLCGINRGNNEMTWTKL